MLKFLTKLFGRDQRTAAASDSTLEQAAKPAPHRQIDTTDLLGAGDVNFWIEDAAIDPYNTGHTASFPQLK